MLSSLLGQPVLSCRLSRYRDRRPRDKSSGSGRDGPLARTVRRWRALSLGAHWGLRRRVRTSPILPRSCRCCRHRPTGGSCGTWSRARGTLRRALSAAHLPDVLRLNLHCDTTVNGYSLARWSCPDDRPALNITMEHVLCVTCERAGQTSGSASAASAGSATAQRCATVLASGISGVISEGRRVPFRGSALAARGCSGSHLRRQCRTAASH